MEEHLHESVILTLFRTEDDSASDVRDSRLW